MPGSRSEFKLARERERIADSLRIILATLGNLREAQLVTDGPNVYEVGVLAGDPGDWKAMPSEGIDANRDYRARFANFDKAFIRVGLVRIDDTYHLRHMIFALPAEPPSNRDIVEAIAVDLLVAMPKEAASP